MKFTVRMVPLAHNGEPIYEVCRNGQFQFNIIKARRGWTGRKHFEYYETLIQALAALGDFEFVKDHPETED